MIDLKTITFKVVEIDGQRGLVEVTGTLKIEHRQLMHRYSASGDVYRKALKDTKKVIVDDISHLILGDLRNEVGRFVHDALNQIGPAGDYESVQRKGFALMEKLGPLSKVEMEKLIA